MKAIYIDSVNQTVEPVEVDGSLANYYRLIRTPTNIMEAVYPRGLAEGDVLYVDEEGLFNGHKTGFRIGDYPQMLMGSGVIVGTGDEGDSIDAKSSLDRVRAAVRWRYTGRPLDK